MRNEDRNGINTHDWMTHEEFIQIFTPATVREQELFDRLVASEDRVEAVKAELDKASTKLGEMEDESYAMCDDLDAVRGDRDIAWARIQDLEEMLAEVASEADAI